MENHRITEIIQVLEKARRRPGMFFPLDKNGVIGFMGGIHAMKMGVFAIDVQPGITEEILRERGWEPNNALAPWPEMEDRGMSIQSMIDEVLIIEIETLRRSLQD